MPPLTLQTPIKKISRVGQSTANKLKRLNIGTAGDLLWHVPFRYDDLSKLAPLGRAPSNENITIKATVELLQNRRSSRKKMILTEGIISDTTGSIKVIWFNQPFLTKNIKIGQQLYFSGKIEEGRFGRHLKNPTYEPVRDEQTTTARIVPVYPATENLTQKQLRFLLQSILPLTDKIQDFLPEEIIKKHHFPPLSTSWREIHFPKDAQTLAAAQHRLKFNELFLIQSYNLQNKKQQQKQTAPQIPFRKEEIQKFVQHLPFTLTADQKKAAWQIIQDMEKTTPMNRLLEGDVGSGKTVVAALVMYNTVLNHYQATIMAPTEILAFQHWQTMNELFPPKKVSLALLTNSYQLENQRPEAKDKKKDRERIKHDIQKGVIQIVIGTHSLIQEDVQFENLGLAIIDEQHRFGVDQRKKLRDESGNRDTFPHFLSMTATPIPRSLALALYGDLDLSRIREKPADRKPIQTSLVRPEQRLDVYHFIQQEIQKERQTFVICPLIEESDFLGVKSATTEQKKLQEEIFPKLKIGLLHGKMKGKEKEAVMKDFKEKKYHILVSTSVVEVGVDVPNATMMMIEGAERFGLAQLHQFRGRIGRGQHQSHCFLFSDQLSPAVFKRLSLMTRYQDGFSLAEADLKMRGPGDAYGQQQSGWTNLKIASWHDTDIMLEAKEAAETLFAKDSDLTTWPLLKRKIQQFTDSVHLE